jgi:cation transport ATPase
LRHHRSGWADGTEIEIPIDPVGAGVIVRPGEWIPLNGTVIAGHD